MTADDRFPDLVQWPGWSGPTGDDWRKPVEVEITSELRNGRINAAIEVFNIKPGSAGLACKIAVEYTDGAQSRMVFGGCLHSTWTTDINDTNRKD